MGKTIVTVLLIVIVVVYGAMFINWNMETIRVVGCICRENAFFTDMPKAYLAMGGVVAGVLVMGIAAWSAWAAQRRLVREAEAKVAAAAEKLRERTDMVRDLRDEVDRLKRELVGRNANALPAEGGREEESDDTI